MQKYVITCFFLAFMTVNQIKANARKRKERDLNNQTDKVTFVSLLNGFKNQLDQDGSSYVSLKELDGNLEIHKGNLTVVIPNNQLKGRRKCKSKRCRRRKGVMATRPSNNLTEPQSVKNALLNLSSHNSPMVIMKASRFKKDWCRTQRMKRKIKEKGCISRTIVNHFCYGQCNSFFIPRLIIGKRDLRNFQSCAYCQPSGHRWMKVTLHCPRLMPPIRIKRILRVDKCKCSTKTSTVF